MISPYRIQWQNSSNLDFNCWTGLAFDEDNGGVSSFLNKEAVFSESYNGTMRRVNHYKYNEVATIHVTFVKKDYSDFTMAENRSMLSWLTGAKKASWLSIYNSNDNVLSYEVLGNFTETQLYKATNGRIIGYVCTFESVSPFAFSAITTKTQTITSSGTLTVNCQSDEKNAYVYPKITLTPSSNANIRLKNTTTGTTVDVVDNMSGETITIDGANKLIASSRDNRVFGTDFSWNWIPLQNGNNTISVALFTTTFVEATGYVEGQQYFYLEGGLYKKASIKNVTEYNTFGQQLYIANYWTQQNSGTCSVGLQWRDPIKIGEI